MVSVSPGHAAHSPPSSLAARYGSTAARDLVAGTLDDFQRARRDTLGRDGCDAIARLVERELALARSRNDGLAGETKGAIRRAIGRFPRSTEPTPLRN